MARFPKKEAEILALAERLWQATLVDQPKGIEIEYRIIAVNKAGDGAASNTVMAVL